MPTLPYLQPLATRDVMSLQLRVERLLRDRNRSLLEGLTDIREILAEARRLAA